MDMENNNVAETAEEVVETESVETVATETVETVEEVVNEPVLEHAEGEVLGVEPESQGDAGKVMGIISLVAGIVSILLLCASYCVGTVFPLIVVIPLITSIAGVILGVLGIKKSTDSKGLAIAGLIVSIVALVVSIPLIGCAACTTCACLGGAASSMSGY